MILNASTRRSFHDALRYGLEANLQQMPNACVYAFLSKGNQGIQGDTIQDDTLLFGAADAASLPENIICAFPSDYAKLGRLIHVANPDELAKREKVEQLCYDQVIPAICRATADEREGTAPAFEGTAWTHARTWVKRLGREGYGPKEADRETGQRFPALQVAGCYVREGKVTISNLHGGNDWMFNFRDLLADTKAEINDPAIVPHDIHAARSYAKARVYEWLARGNTAADAAKTAPLRGVSHQALYRIAEGKVFIQNEVAEKPGQGWMFDFDGVEQALFMESKGLGIAIEADCHRRGLKARGLGRVEPERSADQVLDTGAASPQEVDDTANLYPIKGVFRARSDGSWDFMAAFTNDGREGDENPAEDYATGRHGVPAEGHRGHRGSGRRRISAGIRPGDFRDHLAGVRARGR